MNKYLELIKDGNIILQDGAYGTMLQTYQLTKDDFGGYKDLYEHLNISKPDILIDLHKQYLQSGAQVLDTNSFGANKYKLSQYGLADKVYDINFAAAKIAKNAINELGLADKFVMGSMGPTGYLPSSLDPDMGKITFDELAEAYSQQATALIDGGADIILLETHHDILETKAGIIGAKKAIQDSQKEIALQVQVTVDANSNMLFGTNILSAFIIVQDMGIDVFGINCSTGPREMENTIKTLSSYSKLPISIIPNAGMPDNVNGCAIYNMTPEEFSEIIYSFLQKYNISIVGGCCGTTPAHIKALKEKIIKDNQNKKIIYPQRETNIPNYTSPITIKMEQKKVYLIGERINSQGSRKAKELMLNNNYEELSSLAKVQQDKGADLIDCCFAMTERNDEAEQLSFFVKKVAYQSLLAISIDSTEPSVIEKAVKSYAGKPIINSINLEDEKIHKVLPIIRDFGLSTIALCIDQNGMAKTVEEKMNVAQKIYDIAIDKFRLSPHQLIFDPLTFTLATGENEWKNSAINTFQAIKLIKEKLIGVKTVLGVSNVSFGLSPQARKTLNLVYLEEAIKNGLDFAIYNVDHYCPLSELNKEEVRLATELIYNKKDNALANFLDYYQSFQPIVSVKKSQEQINEMSLEEIIQHKIINRDNSKIIETIEQLKKEMLPEDIINNVLLKAMKKVGEKMEKGEIILPFVLESAEIMKKAITYLEQYLDKNNNISKGTIVLATVFGDVHDIGKNLVKTITENNGFKVIDLGKQVPVDNIINTAIKEKALAISLSALLVSTSKQMDLVVKNLHQANLSIPVIIGGAAINHSFAQQISNIQGVAYAPGVFYAKDVFEGLKILEKLSFNEKNKNN
jgi:5-methyltetrahydrofolate--homocysteine methyltransferase